MMFRKVFIFILLCMFLFALFIGAHIDYNDNSSIEVGVIKNINHDHFLLYIVTIIALFLISAVIYQLLLNKWHKSINIQSSGFIDDMSSVINNMPILYMQLRAITSDSSGEATNLICTNINEYFKEVGLTPDDTINRDLSSIDKDLNHSIIEVVNSTFKDKDEANFTLFYKEKERYYQVKMKRGAAHDLINIFFIDSTTIYSMNSDLAETNNRLALALDVSNITLWQLNYKKSVHIFYDYKVSDQKGKLSVDKENLSMSYDDAKERIYKDDLPLFESEINKLIEGENDKMRIEVRLRRVVDGKPVMLWHEMICVVEKYDNDKRPLTFMGLSMNISERKRYELELINEKNKAEELNNLKSAFLANMSHEIRTPLNAIIGFSQILASTSSEEERLSYMDIIETNNNLLLQLINDVLDLSKIEAGVIEFNKSDVNLKDTLAEAAEVIRNKNTNPNVEIIYDKSTPSITLYTDANRVLQIITNLMNNSLKFTDKGFIKLSCEPKANDIYVYVEDSGMGIPLEKQMAIFERFTKLNSFKQGTGLGLSICKTLVHQLGGNIGVVSEVGKGSKFWFSLPLDAQ